MYNTVWQLAVVIAGKSLLLTSVKFNYFENNYYC